MAKKADSTVKEILKTITYLADELTYHFHAYSAEALRKTMINLSLAVGKKIKKEE